MSLRREPRARADLLYGLGAGYSCPPGAEPPVDPDRSLVCGEPTVVDGADDYCCAAQ
jgi:hypothetical protein